MCIHDLYDQAENYDYRLRDRGFKQAATGIAIITSRYMATIPLMKALRQLGLGHVTEAVVIRVGRIRSDCALQRLWR